MANEPKIKLLIMVFAVIFIITCFFVVLGRGNKSNTNIFIPSTDLVQDSSSKEKSTVKKVIDGDTIELTNGSRVRYIGIDTPEITSSENPDECYSLEATNKNKELVEGKKIKLEKDVSETDQYGRLLRYVYLEDGTFVNLELAKTGFAVSDTFPPDVKHQQEFQEAEREARQNGLGLWSACQNKISN